MEIENYNDLILTDKEGRKYEVYQRINDCDHYEIRRITDKKVGATYSAAYLKKILDGKAELSYTYTEVIRTKIISCK